MSSAKVLVAGGGIGGLTAALSFARFGFSVQVFEQAPVFSDAGAGIQLSPNCTRVLHDLGLEQEVSATGFLPRGVEVRHWKSGAVIASSDFENHTEKYGFPYYHIHRSDLMDVLVRAASADPNIRLHPGTAIELVKQDSDAVRVVTGAKEYRGDLLAGADGIRSVVRNSLFGPDEPEFTGNIAWRGVVATDQLPKDFIRPVATVWWGPRRHFVHYYVRNGTCVNCVCVVEKDGWETESWTEKGSHTELKNDFSGWHDTVTTLIDNINHDACFKWALFDRPPMPLWGQDRITLLGDACHPMLPFLAQGAAMAVEDAAVLARCVDAGKDIPSSLIRYQELRRDRTAWVQKSSRRNKTLFHATGVTAWVRNRVAGLASERMFDRLFSYDATRLRQT